MNVTYQLDTMIKVRSDIDRRRINRLSVGH
jgi:hypothetical protein